MYKIYVAEDGKQFYNEDECRAYEEMKKSSKLHLFDYVVTFKAVARGSVAADTPREAIARVEDEGEWIPKDINELCDDYEIYVFDENGIGYHWGDAD